MLYGKLLFISPSRKISDLVLFDGRHSLFYETEWAIITYKRYTFSSRKEKNMRKIFLGFIVYALAELALLIVIGQNIGVLSTLLLIIATSVLGVYVMKNKGMNSIQNVKNTLARGEAPGSALVDTLLTFSGGLLLALPGFMTDLIGLLLLLPFSRKMFQPVVYYWMRKKMKKGQFIIVQR